MAREIAPPEDLGVRGCRDGCRWLEMALLKTVLQILAHLFVQAKEKGDAVAGEIEDSMRRLIARYRRLQAQEESSEEPEYYG